MVFSNIIGIAEAKTLYFAIQLSREIILSLLIINSYSLCIVQLVNDLYSTYAKLF